MLLKSFTSLIFLALFLEHELVLAQVLTVRTVGGRVELVVSSYRKDVGYQIERSLDFWDWVGGFDHSVGSHTVSISSDEVQSAFYRLNIFKGFSYLANAQQCGCRFGHEKNILT